MASLISGVRCVSPPILGSISSPFPYYSNGLDTHNQFILSSLANYNIHVNGQGNIYSLGTVKIVCNYEDIMQICREF